MFVESGGHKKGPGRQLTYLVSNCRFSSDHKNGAGPYKKTAEAKTSAVINTWYFSQRALSIIRTDCSKICALLAWNRFILSPGKRKS